MNILIIGIGATFGASLRYYLSIWSKLLFGANFAYGTLLANIGGSFLAGLLLVMLLEKNLITEPYRLLLIVGLCGSLTTFSTFSVETIQLIEMQNYQQAGLNIILNMILALVAVVVGMWIARQVW